MPRYDFACPACGAHFEASTGMDEPGPVCPVCGTGPSQRLITGFGLSRSPALRGLAARRSNATRGARETQREERREQRRRDRSS